MNIALSSDIHVELIAVGSELTRGTTMDVNSPYLAGRFLSIGLEVKKISVVGDNETSLAEVLEEAKTKKGFIIVSGGLGPTFDDITKKVAARVLGRSLVLNQKVLDKMKERLVKRGVQHTAAHEVQAIFPLKSEPIPNLRGTAWGFYIRYESAHFFFLPGVPLEVTGMVEEGVLHIINREFNLLPAPSRRLFKVFGLKETEVEGRIKEVLEKDAGVRFAIRVNFPEIHLEISARNGLGIDGHEIMAEYSNTIEESLSPYIVARDDETIESVVGRNLRDKTLTLFAAESCTGGLLGHRITAVAGSSKYFAGDIVAYSNSVKEKTLGVSSVTLKRFGAVSRETAIEMAKGARHLGGTDIGLAITGVAGPEGGTKEKPVGTVYIALFDGVRVRSERFRFFGNREAIKILSSQWALEMLRRYLIES
ncbi:MAG: CinA family nicotinamide mononucleotide deamidase-related protein [Thermodesulfobacteriota bacterium]